MTPYELECRDRGEHGVVIADISGELDLTNARELEERLAEVAPGGLRLVLDLNRVIFVDSAALHALFRTAERLGSGRFGVALGPGAALMRTLTIVGLADTIPVRASAEQVVAALVSPAG
jgi:anti-anti-sigma factor